MSSGGHESWPGGKIVIIVLTCLVVAGVGGWYHSGKIEIEKRKEAVEKLQKKLNGKVPIFKEKLSKTVESTFLSIGQNLLNRPPVRVGDIGDFPLTEVIARFLSGDTADWKEKLGRNGIQVMDMLLAIDELPAVGADYGIIVKKDGTIAFKTSKVTFSGQKAAKDAAKRIAKGETNILQRWISSGEGSVDLVTEIPIQKDSELLGSLVVGVSIKDSFLIKVSSVPGTALLYRGRLVAANGPVCVKALEGDGGLEKASQKDGPSAGFLKNIVFVTGRIKEDQKNAPFTYALCEKLQVPREGFAGYVSRYYWYGGIFLALLLSAIVAFLAHRKEDNEAIEEDTDLGGWDN
ncbi:MAG: hypothetical protein GXP49_02515 [Deltaproteobacteria bacterium]|nr:hypothetical protein [Deltaproteobacteria bacterium]